MRQRSILFFALLVIAIDGCGERTQPPDTTAESPTAQRIISLIPSVTETIVALGAGDRLVARSRYDIDPDLAHLPSVGEGLTPSVEQLTALQPDLVIAWPDNPARSVIERLQGLGVAIYGPQVQSLADVRRMIGELGDLLELESAANSLIGSIDAGLEQVGDKVAGLARPSVFFVIWYDPPMTTGGGTYVDELIEIAGGRNIFADAPGLWPQVSMEEIVRRQPQLILFSRTADTPIDIEGLRDQVGWRELQAIRDGRALAVDANIYNRPGPRVAEAAQGLARLLHPEAFNQEERR